MEDWIKHAKNLEEQEELQRRKERQEAKSRTAEILESEKDWIDRVLKRVQAIQEHGILINAARNPAGLVLSHKGVAEIQLLGPMNFWIRFHNVIPSSRLILRHPITVHHHRIVRVRVLNEHNTEEILKFVSLGTDNYSELARYVRIEKNLEHVLEATNQEEHVKGEF